MWLCCSQSQLRQQPVQTSNKMDGPHSVLQLKNGKTNWPVWKVRNGLECTPPWINQYRIYAIMDVTTEPTTAGMGRAGMVYGRFWVKIHLPHRPAVAWALSLVCAKYCDRSQPHWHCDACDYDVTQVCGLIYFCGQLHGDLHIVKVLKKVVAGFYWAEGIIHILIRTWFVYEDMYACRQASLILCFLAI